MRICLISVEIFAWGKHGGFGRATRLIGRELAKRGHEVFAVVPRRAGQRERELLDGIRVLGFDPWRPWEAARLVREADAGIHHSCEPSLTTWIAKREMPGRRHMVTFRDPRDLRDWWMEFSKPSLSRAQVVHNFLFENAPPVRRVIREMDAVFAIAKYLCPKVKRMYGLDTMPRFLPTPVAVPTETPEKSAVPTVCYMARLDRRKRPELFLDLARRFPDVRFIAAGKSRDAVYERGLRDRFAGVSNLEFAGFLDQFEGGGHSGLLERSRILVNTATREALPNSYLEAMAHGCALLSHVDPDGFASRFGYHAAHDDFEEGLGWLLSEGRWKPRGEAARAHVREVFELSHAIDLHEAAYRELLSR